MCLNGANNPGPYRRDRNEHGGGLMIFIKQGVHVKRIKKFELETAESICLETTISRRKWIMFSIYRPQSFNLQRFFQELEISVDKATSAYDNVIIMGDINIDTSCTTSSSS